MKIECNCSSENNCKRKHDNLYEAIYCELRAYAYVKKGEKTVLDEEKLLNIIVAVERILSENQSILRFNSYIENLLKDLRSSTKGGKRKTRKIKHKK